MSFGVLGNQAGAPYLRSSIAFRSHSTAMLWRNKTSTYSDFYWLHTWWVPCGGLSSCSSWDIFTVVKWTWKKEKPAVARTQTQDHWLRWSIYCSLPKKGPWAEHLTSLPKRGVGALLTVSTFNHERVPTSCLQWLEALKANNWTQINVQRNHQSSPDSTQHSERHDVTVSIV